MRTLRELRVRPTMVGAPDVVQPWMPRAARDRDAWLCHVSMAGGGGGGGCPAAGVSEFSDGPLALCPDVARRRADQPAEALLLEDVRRPARGPRAREQRREQLRGDGRAVEHDRRPVLD